MIKFIHTADIHFGVENYGRVDSKTGIHSRLLDFARALDYCIDYSIDQNVDFFLFAGDAYKTTNPTPTQQKLLVNCLLKLYKANIPVIMIVGNHDNPLSFGKANSIDIFEQLPINGFHIISKPTIVNLETKNGPVQIVGIPWPTRNNIAINNEFLFNQQFELTKYISSCVCKIISEFAITLDQSLPAILAGHLTVATGVFSGSEKQAVYGTDPIFLPSQIAIKPFDYVALGHLHRFQNLNPDNNPPIIYSGSIERVDFGERNEDKGFCLVKIIEKYKVEYEFIKTPVRPFIQIDIHLNDTENQTEQILNKISQYNIDGAIIKILYYLPKDKNDKVDMNIIQQECSKAWYIVGILPIRTYEPKQKRLLLKIDMELTKLLECYFDSKIQYRKSKDRLISKILEIEKDINIKEEDKDLNYNNHVKFKDKQTLSDSF